MGTSLRRHLVGIVRHAQALVLEKARDVDRIDAERRAEAFKPLHRSMTVDVHGHTVRFAGSRAERARRGSIAVVLPVDLQVRDEAVDGPVGDTLARDGWESHPANGSGNQVRARVSIHLARKGSPGIKTVFAKSPFFALLCGVAIFVLLLLSFKFSTYSVA